MRDIVTERSGSSIGKTPKVFLAAALCAILVLALVAALSGCAGAPPGAAPDGPGDKNGIAAGPRPEPAPEPAAPADGFAMDEAASSKLSAATGSGAREADAAVPPPEYMMTEAAPSAAKPSTGRLAATAQGQSGLKAGFADDNEQFNLFVKFLDQYKDVPHAELDVRERILVKVRDSEGKPALGLPVTVEGGGRTLARGTTYADGSFSIYPLDYVAQEFAGSQLDSYNVTIAGPKGAIRRTIGRSGSRVEYVDLPGLRPLPAPLPVDVLFVLDTTGSMGEEIERLRSTIEIINANIASLKPKPALRFGMVLYKDTDDEYVTRKVPFTDDLDLFQEALEEVEASGGGDTPEDLQAALDAAVRGMDWNPGGIRLGFVITDAPPHLDYGQDYDYAAASRDAKAAGIKLFGIGTGGLPLEGEYILRQVAQYTQGKYIFLTYGEAGEAAGGKEGSVSHHTGTNFTTDKLEAVVIRFVKEEIARQSDTSLEYDESYYAAQRVEDESREETLGKLFAQALQGLSDYSTWRLTPETRLAVMPISPAEGAPEGLGAQAEYLGSQLSLAASGSKLFTVVERKDLQKILGELELQLSSLADEDSAAKVGKFLGAEVLVTGTVFRKSDIYEVFLKLVRVETAEVLSANKAKIAVGLGL